MPFIFPRRYIRKQDILTPEDFKSDLEPVNDILTTGFDRHNFIGNNLKSKLEPDTQNFSDATADNDKRIVFREAYHSFHYKSVESFYYMDNGKSTPPNYVRHPPNFVKPDGKTFRYHEDKTFASDGKPFIIPHTGEWSAVRNADLSEPMKITFESKGEANLWLCAYLQYIWQGFYEHKSPWATRDQMAYVVDPFRGSRVKGSDIGWDVSYDNKELALKERDVLNVSGPDLSWDATANETQTISDAVKTEELYAYPLNEPSAKVERSFPNLGGQHHISKGFYPSLVQFALRVDGKIIEETITGKDYSFEESDHGLQIADSTIASFIKDSKDFYSKRVAQRSNRVKAYYGAWGEALAPAGQKLPRSRAVSCGPEVMPVRIGATVPISAGKHTIEIVARRLDRKKGEFQYGDFVGVFSRRLYAMELHKLSSVSDAVEDDDLVQLPPEDDYERNVSWETEDVIYKSRVRLPRNLLKDACNSIRSPEIKRHSLPNTHLPSKVAYAFTRTLSSNFSRNVNNGLWEPTTESCQSHARFPGFNNTAIDTHDADGVGWTDEDTFGWEKVRGFDKTDEETKALAIISDQLSPSTTQDLILMADLEVKWIRGILSAKARAMLGSDVHENRLNAYTSYLQDGKYLDLFALFAIGYRTSESDSSWVIASEKAPAMVNSYTWVNRSKYFVADWSEGDTKLVEAAYGTGASDYSFTVTERPTDKRGGNTLPSNLGCNVPLVCHLTGVPNIKEVAVFVSTTFPSEWWDVSATHGGDTSSSARQKVGPDGDYYPVWDAWASPAFGRGILSGVETCVGNASLTALKINK